MTSYEAVALKMASMHPITTIQRGDALVIVDVQNDFLPGGALAVARGNEVVPVLNRYILRFSRDNLPIIATRDWHPADHCSFTKQGGRWPEHCVMNTHGAEFPLPLALPRSVIIISKASRSDREAYSGFDGTDLEQQLQFHGARRLFIGGLATDYCVRATAGDARRLGFEVVLLRDAIRAVNAHPDDGQRAEEEMLKLGAVPLQLEALAA